MITERADFDERYFMLQSHSQPYRPPPRPDTLLETLPTSISLPDMLDDMLDAPDAPQKPVHGEDGSTASDLPSLAPASPPRPVVQFQSPASTYHSLPPSPTPSPSPALSRPQCLRQPREQWLPEQWAVPDRYRLPREPTPAVESSSESDSNSDHPLDLIQAGAASTAEPTSYRQFKQRSDAYCGRKHVTKRWRHTESMALGRSSNCPLGSVQLAPDGS